jgi:hypothetical protein
VKGSIIIKREEIDMDQGSLDQGWLQLQANIERFLGQSLQRDGQRLEYKPRFIATLSEMSSETHQMEGALPHSRRSASGIAVKKGGM